KPRSRLVQAGLLRWARMRAAGRALGREERVSSQEQRKKGRGGNGGNCMPMSASLTLPLHEGMRANKIPLGILLAYATHEGPSAHPSALANIPHLNPKVKGRSDSDTAQRLAWGIQGC
ncbi:hypothetical protein THAOC_12592, partial [Thalassiosira oceanica]